MHAKNYGDGTLAGILVSLPALGLSSDVRWRCSSDTGKYGASVDTSLAWTKNEFDGDYLWDDAIAKGYVGSKPWGTQYFAEYSDHPSPRQHVSSAQWIWARNLPDGRIPEHAFCRFTFAQVGGNETAAAADLKADLADGAHAFRVRATDYAGNGRDASVSFTWEIDNTAPVAELTHTPSATSSSSSPSASSASPARVASANAEFRFDAANETVGGQEFRGRRVKPAFRIMLDGVIQNGLFCPPGSYLCGDSCRVIKECDSDLADGVRHHSPSLLLPLTVSSLFPSLHLLYHTLQPGERGAKREGEREGERGRERGRERERGGAGERVGLLACFSLRAHVGWAWAWACLVAIYHLGTPTLCTS